MCSGLKNLPLVCTLIERNFVHTPKEMLRQVSAVPTRVRTAVARRRRCAVDLTPLRARKYAGSERLQSHVAHSHEVRSDARLFTPLGITIGHRPRQERPDAHARIRPTLFRGRTTNAPSHILRTRTGLHAAWREPHFSFGTRPFEANHIPGPPLKPRHIPLPVSPPSVALAAVRAATLTAMVLLGAACGGGGDSGDAAAPAAGVEPIADDSRRSGHSRVHAIDLILAVVRALTRGSLARQRAARRAQLRRHPQRRRRRQRRDPEALDTMKPGETLWFPVGRYLMNRSRIVRRPGITISGDGSPCMPPTPTSWR